MNTTTYKTTIQIIKTTALENSTEAKDSPALNGADTCWVLVNGLGYFYGGMTRKKSLLTMLMSSGLAIAVVSFQWFLWGYSLTFTKTGSRFIGNLDHVVLIDVGNEPHPLATTIPANVFMIFQCMFACITPALAFGGAAERTPILTYTIFLFIWSTLVYDFIAYWTWAPNGWLHDFGVLDFAGGTPVHITSGFSALAYALAVGPRRTVVFEKHKPSNPSDIYLGTALLWFGWFGFNGGSEVAINSRAVNAVVISNIAASFGGITWIVIEMIKTRSRRMSLNGFNILLSFILFSGVVKRGFCAGAVVGLVSITPGSGYLRPHFAIVVGILGSIVCYFSCELKKMTKYKYDDACDVFGVHGMGGIVGCIMTGIFADKDVVTMSGDASINGGWVNRNFIQVPYQLLSIAAAMIWSFLVTFLILQAISLVPCLHLRLTKEEEEIGSDLVELGETAYGHDIVATDAEILESLRITRISNYHNLKNLILKTLKKDKDINSIDKRFTEFGNFNEGNNIENSERITNL